MANQGGQNLVNHAGPTEHPPVVDGTVSYNKPAPGSFSDPLWVVISSGALYECTQWVKAQGKTLPAQGAAVTVLMSQEGVPTVVWFAGEYT